MNVTNTTYDEALSDRRIQSFIDQVHALPSADEYAERVEERFRTEVLNTSGSGSDADYLRFSELPDSTRRAIGYTEDGSLPWWLRDFDWGFEHSNAEHITTENLERLSNSNPERTEIKLPTLGESDIQTALESLSEIGESLSEQWEIEPDSDPNQPDLSENLFKLSQTDKSNSGGAIIQATENYKNFFKTVIRLCPPFNPVLQTLSMVISGVDEIYYQLLPESVEKRVSELDIRRGRSFGRSLSRLYTIDTEFGIEIEIENHHEALSKLEQLQYQTWRQKQRQNTQTVELIRMACERVKSKSKISDIESIAKSLLVSPVYLDSKNCLTLFTLRREYGFGKYSRDQEEKVFAIAEVLNIDTEEIDDW